MTAQELTNLHGGDQVTWTDPCTGESEVLTISNIYFSGGVVPGDDLSLIQNSELPTFVVFLETNDGRRLEAFAPEFS